MNNDGLAPVDAIKQINLSGKRRSKWISVKQTRVYPWLTRHILWSCLAVVSKESAATYKSLHNILVHFSVSSLIVSDFILLNLMHRKTQQKKNAWSSIYSARRGKHSRMKILQPYLNDGEQIPLIRLPLPTSLLPHAQQKAEARLKAKRKYFHIKWISCFHFTFSTSFHSTTMPLVWRNRIFFKAICRCQCSLYLLPTFISFKCCAILFRLKFLLYVRLYARGSSIDDGHFTWDYWTDCETDDIGF